VQQHFVHPDNITQRQFVDTRHRAQIIDQPLEERTSLGSFFENRDKDLTWTSSSSFASSISGTFQVYRFPIAAVKSAATTGTPGQRLSWYTPRRHVPTTSDTKHG
jgi:hypothetical protein